MKKQTAFENIKSMAIATAYFLAPPFLPTLHGQDTASAIADDRVIEIPEVSRVISQHFPPETPGGIGVLITRNGEVIHRKGYGTRKGKPLTPQSSLRLAFISKQFAAMCAAMLIEEGKLDPQEKVSRYMPELKLPVKGRELLVQDLLWHISGLSNFINKQEQTSIVEFRKQLGLDFLTNQTHAEWLTTISKVREPGMLWEYTNSGYVLLARVIEVIAGEPFHQFQNRRIFDVLGMADTTDSDRFNGSGNMATTLNDYRLLRPGAIQPRHRCVESIGHGSIRGTTNQNQETTMTRITAFLIFLLSEMCLAEKVAPPKPNVVMIFADDLGWVDLACYGSNYYQTLHLDSLAKQRMIFTESYAANPICSPTCASILTGRWPSCIGITLPHCHQPEEILKQSLIEEAEPTQIALEANCVTRLDTSWPCIGKCFKMAEYATGHIGKWHPGKEPYSPLEHGFDEDIRRHAKEPIYLQYWMFSVHGPWDARKELLEKYAKLADPAALQRHPVYAAMIEHVDQAVGKVVAELERQNLMERTMIVFTSHNGPVAVEHGDKHMHKDYRKIPVGSAKPLRGDKGSIYKGGTRSKTSRWRTR